MAILDSNQDETSPPAAGQFGRFHLQELINSGGMADLWLADAPNGKHCAVRRLHKHLRLDWTSRKRFFSGCEILAKVYDHEFIVDYIEHGSIGMTPYLAMEYVEGNNLKELYARHDPVLLDNIAQILIDMATALEHMHSSGFMHLDFKPENVLVTRNGGIRLVDFDLSQPIPDKPKKAGSNPGTPAYMAPEQFQRLPIDHRVDIFAFGVAAYELLTNQKPFPGEEARDILNLQLDRSGFLAPSVHNPDMPRTLEKIVLKCLENEPNRRYHFMSLLLRDLQAALYL